MTHRLKPNLLQPQPPVWIPELQTQTATPGPELQTQRATPGPELQRATPGPELQTQTACCMVISRLLQSWITTHSFESDVLEQGNM